MEIYFDSDIRNIVADAAYAIVAKMVLVTISGRIYGIEMDRKGERQFSRHAVSVNDIPSIIPNARRFGDENEFIEKCNTEYSDEYYASEFIEKTMPLDFNAMEHFPNITYPDAYEIDFIKNEILKSKKRKKRNVIAKMKNNYLGLLKGNYYLGRTFPDTPDKVFIEDKRTIREWIVPLEYVELGRI